MYVKGLFEVFKILGRLGIKPKDVIGLGGDVVKMGKSLFNTRINPKLLQFVEKNQKIPTKIIEEIKIHARTLKNATESQKNLFQANIKDLLNAKTPKTPVTSVQRPATSVKEQVTADAFKGWKPTVIKGGKDKLATGGRVGFQDGTDEDWFSYSKIGPQLPDDGKISLDEIVAKVVGPKENRIDWGIEGFTGGPMTTMGRARGIQSLTKGNVQEKANNIFKSMLYVAKNSKKEKVNTLYSAFNGVLDFNIKNQATGVETDIANKLATGVFDINEGVPSRIDENTIFDIALQTYDLLPNDLKAEINASTNLAKDESWNALLEGNALGIEYNSDNQKIEGYYNIELDSETLKPTLIKPMFEKDNMNDEITKSLFIGHGDFPPNPENFQNPEHYQMAYDAWAANKNNEYFGIDLVSKPESDYTGAKGTFSTENVSGWGAVESSPDFNLAETQITGTIPNYLLKDSEPIEISGGHYQDLDTDDKETTIRADVPLPLGITPYYGKTTGDWGNTSEYGINLNKSGELGNWDYNVTGNIDQDKDYKIEAGIGTDNINVGGWYDADGNWHAGITANWKWGEPERKKKQKTYTTSNPEEAWAKVQPLFATGGIANHFRKK